VIAGEQQPAIVHALAHAINAALGNDGKTVVYIDPIEAQPVNEMDSIRELVGDMNAGKVDTLLIIGGNPVYKRARRSRFWKGARSGQAPPAAWNLQRRNLIPVPLARSADPFPGIVERRTRL